MWEQVKILLLMTVALAVIVLYAFLPQKIFLGGVSLKKINLSEIKKAETAGPKIEKRKAKKRKHHKILFIGDSMVEGLSRRIGDYAKENGHTVYTVIWYSSTTEKWANTKTLEHFLQKYQPSYILLCLGSNELFVKDLEERKEYIHTILKKMGNRPYLWIGPADWNGDTGIVNLIASQTGKGRFFDSRHLELRRGADHYHPTWDAAADWMDHVAVYLGTNATDIINMKLPKQHHKVERTELLTPTFEGY